MPSYEIRTEYGGDTGLNAKGAGPEGNKSDLHCIAKLWAYDATAGLCAPARLYNQSADAMRPSGVVVPIPLTKFAASAHDRAGLTCKGASIPADAWIADLK